MAKIKPAVSPDRDDKHFSFPSPEKALVAFRQACQLLEEKFFMDPSTLIKLTDRVVTVPIWFPFHPKE